MRRAMQSSSAPFARPTGAGKRDSPIFADAKIGTGPDFEAILPALADAARRFQIPHEHLEAVIDGVEMDLDARRYETFEELLPYCQRVASAVGLACIHLWGFRGPEAFEPARQAGVALQLTNILRDLRQDAQAGRVYLPLADLRQFGFSTDDLLSGVDDDRFRRLMAMEVARAEQFYRGGAELGNGLNRTGRRIFGLIMATYRSLLRKIARRPGDVLRRQRSRGPTGEVQAFRPLGAVAASGRQSCKSEGEGRTRNRQSTNR